MAKSNVEIIYFYMDGCYYCKEFNPVWNELCEKIKNIIQTVKYNANEMKNDIPKKIITDLKDNGYKISLWIEDVFLNGKNEIEHLVGNYNFYIVKVSDLGFNSPVELNKINS